ncbi:hypothetical protein NZD88_14730 [Chryseobacterium antibioticum]|uniref:Uncharacterized protein n=1 Tax=Chryseobacterium pyrolae TaxID=2987481 RepID=A0ABT2IJK0_9FLAO|nr:hypothetical protein [Chryseobacterium pyrolae]MCT2408798.1 hypothetical protein [Chryseobacterium pyrolae]
MIVCEKDYLYLTKKEYSKVGQGFSPNILLEDLSDVQYMKTASGYC